MGLLTPIGEALDVSPGTAGLMVTVPGLVAGLAAPLLTARAGTVDRKVMLAGLIGLMAVANLVCALAPHFAVVLVARLVVGVSVGGFWAIAGGLAVRLVPPGQVAAATAVIFGGVSTASVLGVPAGTLIGELTGWRGGFAGVAILGLVALAALLLLVPRLPAQRTIGLPDLPALLRANTGVRIGVIVTALLITGHFAAYTFARPLLHDLAGIDDGWIGALLMAYGLAGVVGNFLARPPGARAPARHAHPDRRRPVRGHCSVRADRGPVRGHRPARRLGTGLRRGVGDTADLDAQGRARDDRIGVVAVRGGLQPVHRLRRRARRVHR
ncbi:MFS transporter [Nonomuraea ferruginea]